jgi:hypothetical protein
MVLIETAYYPYYDGDKIAASRVEIKKFNEKVTISKLI